MGIGKIDGTPVKDAKRAFNVHVTERDIAQGTSIPTGCAFALAIKRTVGAAEVRVHATRIFVKKDHWQRYDTPQAMLKQLELFDNTGKMGPGVYTIKPVCESHLLGAKFNKTNNGPPRLGQYLKKRQKGPRYVGR